MAKIQNLWAKLRQKMKSPPNNEQSKAFVRVIQFFAIMLVLTIFARGTAGVTMPRVTAANTKNAEIVNSISTTGTIIANGSTDMELPAGLTVSKIYASQGSSVKEGDDILLFDMQAVNEELQKQNMQLQTLELELRELQLPADTNDSGVNSAQKAVDSAQNTYNKAQAAVTSALGVLEGARAAHNPNYEALLALQNSDNPDPAAVEAAQILQDESWQVVVEADAAYTAAIAERDAAGEILADAKTSLNEAIEAYQKSLASQAIANDRTALAIEQKKIDIEKQEQLIAELEKALSNDGRFTATASGIISQLPVEEGATTVENTIVRITTSENGYLVECQVSQADSKNIKVGSNLGVKESGYYYYTDAPVISKTMPDANGMVTIRASLPGTSWEAGNALDIKVTTSSQNYGSCVPLSAVHSDSNGDYVYVLREENTILGQQTVARRVAVTVLAKDANNAAIDGVYGELVLITSTKPVNEGDRVRIEATES